MNKDVGGIPQSQSVMSPRSNYGNRGSTLPAISISIFACVVGRWINADREIPVLNLFYYFYFFIVAPFGTPFFRYQKS